MPAQTFAPFRFPILKRGKPSAQVATPADPALPHPTSAVMQALTAKGYDFGYFHGLTQLKNAQPIYSDEESGLLALPLGKAMTPDLKTRQNAIEDLLSLSIGMADTRGLIIEAKRNSWSGIEPLPQYWSHLPGAHRRWKAAIQSYEEYFGGEDTVYIDYFDVIDAAAITRMQGVCGWRVDIKQNAGDYHIAFIHEDED